MNKSILEFLEEEYDYVPITRGRFDLSEAQIEALLIHMAEDSIQFLVQRAIDRLEPHLDLGILAIELQAAASEAMDHYHGVDV